MNRTTADILTKIIAHKKAEVQLAKEKLPLPALMKQPIGLKQSFYNALKKAEHAAIIAEIKKASPSKGIIREDFDVANIAKIYEANGASCLSVLTDEHFFKGHLDNLKIARSASSLPILRKDFIIDAYQIYESACHDADCILLIAAVLDDREMQDFCQLAGELDLDVLVEVHDENELERALQLPTPLIGINNRNLKNFHTDLQTSVRLFQNIPADRLTVTESGIHSHDDIQAMMNQGIHSFLIGETLMRSPDIAKKLRQLITGH